jgi:aminoglycoside/choline kinase family phosphotransferase
MHPDSPKIKEEFARLYEKWSGEPCLTIAPLPESGSYRTYARVSGTTHRVIAVHHTDLRENRAFLGFANHFLSKELPVPKILAVAPDQSVYLQEDFGDTDLFTLLRETDGSGSYSAQRRKALEQVIDWLPKFQIDGHQGLDYSLAYPRRVFDQQSMLWDLNYFKYNFLKMVRFGFDEQALEDDFQKLSEFLCKAPINAFLYRDFQSRNIMVHDGKPGFIDFQGGRMGFPAYDLASLLFDAKAEFTPEEREWMYDRYRKNLAGYEADWEQQLDRFYTGFVLIRKMQALGAFGFRGISERKKSFLLSIPPAMKNLEWVTNHYHLDIPVPELWRILAELPGSPGLETICQEIKEIHIEK